MCSLGVRTWKINDMKEKQKARCDGENRLANTSRATTRDQKPCANLLTIFAAAKV